MHQCIRSLVGAVLPRTIMDISARAFSLADRPRSGHSGHQCSHALGRPNLHLVSSSRRPRLETVDRVTSSLAPHIAQFLCSSQGPFLRPGPQSVDRAARRGETCSANAGNEPMFSNMLAAIATRVGPIRPAIVFEVVIYAPLRMRHRAMISRVQSPRVERIGRAESLSSSFCRLRASRPE